MRGLTLRTEGGDEITAMVLLVEDNIADAKLVVEALREHKVAGDLVLINNGESAIDYIDQVQAEQSPRPDLVIVDLNLPRQPGTEVLRRMMSCPRCQGVPTVILTSSDNQKDKATAASVGAYCYLTKPSELDDFLALGATFKNLINEYKH